MEFGLVEEGGGPNCVEEWQWGLFVFAVGMTNPLLGVGRCQRAREATDQVSVSSA